MLNPIFSDNATVIIGKGNNPIRTTYVYDDKNGITDIEIEFYQEGDKYYYRYKAGDESYPENYSKGEEFDPGKVLEINVSSKDRVSDDDLSGANATIINNTDMPVNIVYYHEDSKNPRLNISKMEGDVIIN